MYRPRGFPLKRWYEKQQYPHRCYIAHEFQVRRTQRGRITLSSATMIYPRGQCDALNAYISYTVDYLI